MARVYEIHPPTTVRGCHIPRTVTPVYIITRKGLRVDAFLQRANAVIEMRRLVEKELQERTK